MTSYRRAGVDLEGADRHVSAIDPLVTATWGPDVVGSFGGFAAGVRVPSGYRSPILMMTTDGVGTKLELARRSGMWDGVGYDLVAMCVDDLVTAGARPIALVDYMAVGALDEERDTSIVASISRACRDVGAALIGGETAEHPGVMAADAVDLAATALGIVEESDRLGPHRVRPGDVVVGLLSPNLRSNGFSLIRRLFEADLDDHIELFLEPSVLYTPTVLSAVALGGVRAGAHITGGGIPGNLPRALPDGLGARLDVGSWEPPPMFELIAERGVSREDMFSTFNMGIGFCVIVDPASTDGIIGQGLPAAIIGEIDESGVVDLR
jgi:phosphoribosylformylglycinamidine cyclo-ligase